MIELCTDHSTEHSTLLCTGLYRITLHCCYTVLHHTVLHYTALSHTAPYFTTHFDTYFTDTAPHHTILHCTSADYTGSTILSSVFGVKDVKLIRLSNCSISKVTVEWPLGALHGDYVCRAISDEVNVITHLKD